MNSTPTLLRLNKMICRNLADYRLRNKMSLKKLGKLLNYSSTYVYQLVCYGSMEGHPDGMKATYRAVLTKRAFDLAWLLYCEREGIDANLYIDEQQESYK